MTVPGRWYIAGPANIRNMHISVLYIFCEDKFKFNVISMLAGSGSVDKPKYGK